MAKTQFLEIPSEIRLHIYSYVLPTALASKEYSNEKPLRSHVLPCDVLRATCKTIKSEIDHEVVKDCAKYVTNLHHGLQQSQTNTHPNVWYEEGRARFSIPKTFSETKTLEIAIDMSKGVRYGVRKSERTRLLPSRVFGHLSSHFRTVRWILSNNTGGVASEIIIQCFWALYDHHSHRASGRIETLPAVLEIIFGTSIDFGTRGLFCELLKGRPFNSTILYHHRGNQKEILGVRLKGGQQIPN
ncbi:hypothetical protein BDV96DRAFT_661991 [Lophiotrema nucula]|uniref:Uncharacterized protein n=1 Tax=Lophiotrema nucula TaxID=690887 RepID=A0A6A5Z2S4_9PLEO|nr:hypothetical protein BDV96DRAFT_661991 [Lophiotrema nucula]